MNSLYQSYQKQNAQRNNVPANLQEMLQNLAQQILPTGKTPEQIVREMMQNNQISQSQFAQVANIADLWTGGRR